MKQNKPLKDIEIDALREIGNIGVGNAATALSRLLNKKIKIFLPDTKIVPVEKFADEVGGPESIVVSLYLQITGDISGECIFLFPKQGAMELIDILMGQQPGTTKIIEEIEESAFKEMSNIFTGSYLNAVAKMLDMQIIPSVPHVATDMAQAIVDFVLIKISKSADELLVVKTSIDLEGHNIKGKFIMLFEEESYRKILAIVKKRYAL